MTLLEGVALYEELGRALAPVPHFVSAVLCGGVLAAAGSDEQRQRWLPEIATGRGRPQRGLARARRRLPPLGVQARAVAAATASPSRAQAPRGLRRGSRAAGGPGAHRRRPDTTSTCSWSTPRADGVTLTQQFSIASDTQYEVTSTRWRSVRTTASGRPGPAGPLSKRCSRRASCCWPPRPSAGPATPWRSPSSTPRTATSSTSRSGPSRRIAHYLADAVTAIDGAEQLVHEAAWAGANGRPARPAGPGGQAVRLPDLPRRRRPWPSRSSGASASPWSSTSSCTSAGPSPAAELGRRPGPRGAGGRLRPGLTGRPAPPETGEKPTSPGSGGGSLPVMGRRARGG